jgi:SAM-dependent methyltransferase
VNAAGIRHEDLTALTFPDRSFGCIGCFEVLEHIPDHRPALHQLFRCLAPGGTLLATVPFALDRVEHIERARLRPDGSVEHLLPAEYHGDPLDGAGVLCFRHFGWNLLPELEAAGFRDAALHFFWSRELGYLGGHAVHFDVASISLDVRLRRGGPPRAVQDLRGLRRVVRRLALMLL